MGSQTRGGGSVRGESERWTSMGRVTIWKGRGGDIRTGKGIITFTRTLKAPKN